MKSRRTGLNRLVGMINGGDMIHADLMTEHGLSWDGLQNNIQASRMAHGVKRTGLYRLESGNHFRNCRHETRCGALGAMYVGKDVSIEIVIHSCVTQGVPKGYAKFFVVICSTRRCDKDVDLEKDI